MWELIWHLDSCGWSQQFLPTPTPKPYETGGPKIWYVNPDGHLVIKQQYLACLALGKSPVPHNAKTADYESLILGYEKPKRTRKVNIFKFAEAAEDDLDAGVNAAGPPKAKQAAKKKKKGTRRKKALTEALQSSDSSTSLSINDSADGTDASGSAQADPSSSSSSSSSDAPSSPKPLKPPAEDPVPAPLKIPPPPESPVPVTLYFGKNRLTPTFNPDTLEHIGWEAGCHHLSGPCSREHRASASDGMHIDTALIIVAITIA